MQPTLLILAAGMASRYGSMKQTEGFGPSGETIMDYSIYDAISAGFGKVVFIIRKDFAENFKANFGNKLKDKIEVDYVYQEMNCFVDENDIPKERTKPWGTGHAILCAMDAVKEPFAVINADDEFADYHQNLCVGLKILTFSVKKQADAYATDIKRTNGGAYQFNLHLAEQSTPIQLGLIGQHNVANALAASCLALACGLTLPQIKQGLEQAQGAAGRMVLHRRQNFTLIDDTYNANPDAMKAAIDELALSDGYKIVVLGAMGELGDNAPSLHQEVGAYAQAKQIDALYCVGAFSENTAQGYGSQAQRFSEQKELIETLLVAIPQGATILVKGSRSARMENVVQALLGF